MAGPVFGLLVGNGQFCGHDTAAAMQPRKLRRFPPEWFRGAWHGISPLASVSRRSRDPHRECRGGGNADRVCRPKRVGRAESPAGAASASARLISNPVSTARKACRREARTAHSRRVPREWQLRAGAEPVPGTIPCLSSFLAAPEHPQRRGLRWLAKAALLLCRLQGFAFHVSRFTLSHVAETGTDVNA